MSEVRIGRLIHRGRQAAAWAGVFAFALWATLAEAPASSLGSPPLCEPSAALVAPWDTTTVLVADDETEDALFAFRITGDGLADQRAVPLPKGGRPHDVEALAALDGRVLVVGSLSRGKDGRDRPKAQRLALYENGPHGLVSRRAIDASAAVRGAGGGVAACRAALFVAPAPDGADAVCAALASGEVNVEGAAAWPSRAGTRAWLGLRAPLAGQHALLLRLVPGEREARFDAVVRLDLDGRGVRELAVAGTTLWGLAGTAQDGPGDHVLWALPLDRVEPGATVRPAVVRAVPHGAEGLAVVQGQIFVTIDAEGDGRSCAGRQFVLPVSATP